MPNRIVNAVRAWLQPKPGPTLVNGDAARADHLAKADTATAVRRALENREIAAEPHMEVRRDR